jgi:uncharacterized protein (TIGR00369 family)
MNKAEILDELNRWAQNTLNETLGMQYTNVGEGYLEATMPVNSKVHQPLGFLHGGATAALAETVGSAASALIINREKQSAFGIELHCTHIKSKQSGLVTAKATLVHQGKSLHVWDIRVEDEEGRSISLCRLTNMVVPRRS